ncbi:hypothetical protein J437_LFUL017432 [Ladona fulva]|uniref:Uncharacterized protein n=1 Tax=Ladona fulva TaxID=123851 RepID=A0A8K0KQ55_LADFU|nr:hypothetical protein J437_LFUL017432 [Ladona fulva]
MSPYLLLTVLAIAASAASETTTKSTLDITTKRVPGIQPLPAQLPGSATPPSYVRDTRQISVTTTPKSRPLTDASKNVPSTTPQDISATPTFPRRRRDSEDEDEKTFPGTGNQRPLFGGAFGQLFATRPLANLFGNRRPGLGDQGVSDLTIQSQTLPAVGLQTLGATQTVSLSNQPEKLTAAQTTPQLASQSATLTGSQSTDQLTSPSTTVTTNLLSEATSTTTHSNDGQTTQSSTESIRKTRDVETESPFPKSKGDANEGGNNPSTTWTTAPTEFKPYTLIANLRTTQKPLGISSQTSFSGDSGSASAFASASSPLSEGLTPSTTAQNKGSIGDGWYKPTSTAVPFKRDPLLQREKRGADQSTQKPQTGSVLGGSTKSLPTSTIKPQYTRASQTSSKSTQKPGLPSTTPRSKAIYSTNSPVRPTRSAVTDSPQKTTKYTPTTTVSPAKRDVLKTTPKPTTAPKRTARDTKSSTTTTQKPQTNNKKTVSN